MSVTSQFPKRCACGLSYSWAAWTALPYRGVQCAGGKTLELRDCACGSTISIEVGWAGEEREAVLDGGLNEHLRDARKSEVA